MTGLNGRHHAAALNTGADVTVTPGGTGSQTSATVHTITGLTTSASYSLILVTWYNNTATVRNVSSATWGGNSLGIVVQNQSGNGELEGAAILDISGSQSGDIVITFSGFISESNIRIYGLENVQSTTPTGTSSDAQHQAGDASVSLTSPGAGGASIGVYCAEYDTTAVSWSGLTESEDIDAGNHRHSNAYIIGSGGTITVTGSGSTGNKVLVCASWR